MTTKSLKYLWQILGSFEMVSIFFMKDDHGCKDQDKQQNAWPDAEQAEKHLTMRFRVIKEARNMSGSISTNIFSIIKETKCAHAANWRYLKN